MGKGVKNFKEIFSEQMQEFHSVAMDIITLKNLTSPKGMAVFTLTLVTSLSLSHLLLGAFICFYLFDFVTGTIASRIESKKEQKETLYWIQSGKIMRGIIKFVVYIQILVFSLILEKMLINSTFTLHSSLIPLTIFQIALCVCVASEFVSNLENAKRAEFDLIAMFKGFIKTIWSLIATAKNGKDDGI